MEEPHLILVKEWGKGIGLYSTKEKRRRLGGRGDDKKSAQLSKRRRQWQVLHVVVIFEGDKRGRKKGVYLNKRRRERRIIIASVKSWEVVTSVAEEGIDELSLSIHFLGEYTLKEFCFKSWWMLQKRFYRTPHKEFTFGRMEEIQIPHFMSTLNIKHLTFNFHVPKVHPVRTSSSSSSLKKQPSARPDGESPCKRAKFLSSSSPSLVI